jgi:putative membrane protein
MMYPRLLVYRLEGAASKDLVDAMDTGAGRLRRIILTPSLILTWLFGLAMAGENFAYYATQPWFWGKMGIVVALTGVHGWFLGLGRRIGRGETPIASKTLRMANEIPMLAAIIAVILVVVQPFA